MSLFGGWLAAQRKSQIQGIAATTGRLRMGVPPLPMIRGRYRWTSRIHWQSAAAQQEVLAGAATVTCWEDPEEQTKVVYGVAHTWDNRLRSSHGCRTIAGPDKELPGTSLIRHASSSSKVLSPNPNYIPPIHFNPQMPDSTLESYIYFSQWKAIVPHTILLNHI